MKLRPFAPALTQQTALIRIFLTRLIAGGTGKTELLIANGKEVSVLFLGHRKAMDVRPGVGSSVPAVPAVPAVAVPRVHGLPLARRGDDVYTQHMKGEIDVPSSVKDDLSEAVEILKGFGAVEVYVFGSLARGDSHEASDIDIATVGLPKDRFFAAYGALLMKLNHPFDLVGLDYGNDFARRLRDGGQLRRVA